jgi:hypothetical protein
MHQLSPVQTVKRFCEADKQPIQPVFQPDEAVTYFS